MMSDTEVRKTSYAQHNEIVVLGCGVIGLTTALRLQQVGRPVRIISRDLPPNTTSDVAPAMWHPYKVTPDERMRRWAGTAFRRFKELAGDAQSGVSPTTIREYYGSPAELPWYAESVDAFRRLNADEIPSSYCDGFETESFVIDTTVYMPALFRRFIDNGGVLEQRNIDSVEEFIFKHASVINCTGLGSRDLAHDESVYPISGHVVCVESAYRQSRQCVIDENGPLSVCYIVPRSSDVLIGGTAVEHDWSDDVDPTTIQHILDKARKLEPGIRDARIIRSMVGLRPARPTVRLERDEQYPWLIHNYGHSGAGFTLSWGCAEEVAEMLGCFAETAA